jgi:hypothetical protein
MRFFNTAGPCEPDRHYMLPAAERFPEARRLIEEGGYFVLHAPRQSGKTTTIKALAAALTAEGRYTALYASCKPAGMAGEHVGEAIRAVLAELRMEADLKLAPELRPPPAWPESGDLTLLRVAFLAWAQISPRPLVLFLDEIDAMYGRSLKSLLDQLHTGYPNRPQAAPWSVILCGMRDVKDYRETLGRDPLRLGSASPFNIKVKSIRLGDFSEDEIAALYAQHTADTGQPFTEAAVARVRELTSGQPWLVNAIARELTVELAIPPPAPITVEHVEIARERLILSRATHLDSLIARLHEPRVRAVVEPMLAGQPVASDSYQEDLEYVRDLGIIAMDKPVRISNPIYHEVVARVLADTVDCPVEQRRFVGPDGRLDLREILVGFAEFWRENGEVLAGNLKYHEVAPQLVLMSYVQGIVNGRGQIYREYGLGRGRIDLLIHWPTERPDGTAAWQREAIELKVWQDRKGDPLARGLDQLEKYLDRCGLDHGALVIFDRRQAAPPAEERTVLSTAQTPKGQQVLLLRA